MTLNPYAVYVVQAVLAFFGFMLSAGFMQNLKDEDIFGARVSFGLYAVCIFAAFWIGAA